MTQPGNDSIQSRIKHNLHKYIYPSIGLLSDFIRVTEAKWSVAIQSILTKCLNVFLVSSFDNERMLKSFF
jgi:chromosome segregation ATPase